MAFLGKEYKFEKQENFEAYAGALDITPEQKQGFIKYHHTVLITKDGDTYTYALIFAGNKREVQFKSGVTFAEQKPGGISQTTFKVDGNTVTHTQDMDEGTLMTMIHEFSDDELVMTYKSNRTDVVARRYFKA